jgi:hypothetical protein
MTGSPFDPIELGGSDADLEATAERLDGYVREVDAPVPPDLVARIQASIDAEPEPSRGWWAGLASALVAWRRPAAALAVVAMAVAVIVGSIAIGDLFEDLRNVGASPDPSPILTPMPSATPSATPTPSLSPSPSPSPSASPSIRPSVAPTSPPSPSESDDDLETPEPSDDPDESDDSGGNSGPGGGGDD